MVCNCVTHYTLQLFKALYIIQEFDNYTRFLRNSCLNITISLMLQDHLCVYVCICI